jgi:uridine kinase
MGSGKTTLVKKLSELLEEAPTLIFDHYEQYSEWPQDIDQWLREGADPNQVKVPKMKEDLVSLLDGGSITHPINNKKVNSSEYILIEDPFGQEREEIAEFVDLVVFIDVPQDVCVVRLVQRALGMNDVDFERTIKSESRDELIKRLESVAVWLKQYMWIRSGLGITKIIKQKADIVIDGMKPIDEIAQEALDLIKHQHMKR